MRGVHRLVDNDGLNRHSRRKVIHPQAHDNYWVILKDDGLELEIGSIGAQFDGWRCAIDNIIPLQDTEAEGIGKDCMQQFWAAWDRLSADPARLTEFLQAKRQRSQ
jgi:hypothetical protein